HVLDTAVMVGAVPHRYERGTSSINLSTYFAMARGRQEVPAMEMTKWFDTNYHYIVPEFEKGQTFQLSSAKAVDDFREAKDLGIHTRPVLLGPISFLLLGKSKQEGVSPLSLLDSLLPVYQEVITRLSDAGADWIQIDEPSLVLDLPDEVRGLLTKTYNALAGTSRRLRIVLTTYFGDTRENLATALRLPVAAVHLDLIRAPQQLPRALELAPDVSLSLGIVDGRNVWKTNLEAAVSMLQTAVDKLGADRILIGPSCSLLHCPVDLEMETAMDAELRGWLAFAKQKVQEIALLSRALSGGRQAVEKELQANKQSVESRRTSPRIHNQQILRKAGSVSEEMLRRKNPYSVRKELQRKRLGIPPFPTTTIGSFPQTQEVRHVRAEFKSGKRNAEQYEDFLRKEIEKTIRFQEEIGLDVLVHGEFERTDMVEYFAERLTGFAFTQNAWVQSYGSRCVRPPIIFGDVARNNPVTVKWSQYAQSLTSRPVKGMLTGPVTILQWSFVRDDQPRSETCKQIALAIRDEVVDLEAAEIKVIQIDEPALREGLPLRRDERPQYLQWAIYSFRLSSAAVRDETQIHTHMCYSEFNDIVESIAALDADVLSI
ncbi:MAG TPA: 5-methyltetrahydropteroyltriglutamate--homocysteine S-methyltransferase, partial [Acidobacteriota bacterium]